MASGRLATALIGLASLLASLAGCGGEDSEEAAALGGAEGRLSKAQYVKRASAICAQHRDRIAGELEPVAAKLDRGEPVGKAEVEQAMEGVVLPGVRSEYEDLRRLPPPRGDEDFLDLMLSKFSRSLENGEEDLARLFRIKLSAYSEFAEGTLMTNEYGIEGCGSLRRSPRAVVLGYAAS